MAAVQFAAFPKRLLRFHLSPEIWLKHEILLGVGECAATMEIIGKQVRFRRRPLEFASRHKIGFCIEIFHKVADGIELSHHQGE